MDVSRRGLIKLGAVGAAAAALPLGRTAMTKSGGDRMRESAFPKPFTLPFVRPPELTPSGTTDVRCPDGVVRSYPMYHLVQTFAIARIMPGFKTPIFGYNGVVPGPTIRVRRGQPCVVRQTNALHTPPPAPDQNAQMRIQAAKVLPNMSPEKALQDLMRVIKAPEFEKREFREKEAVFSALGATNQQGALAHFAQMLQQKSLLRRAKLKEDKLLAIAGLSAMPSIPCVKLLQSVTEDRSNDPEVLTAARKAFYTMKKALFGDAPEAN